MDLESDYFMLKIDIVSGFLGAGKTTFIKRLLETEIKNEKIVLIENEFGEISVDSMFLGEAKIDIAELSQGCICCSLVGDFAKSLNEVIEKYNPDRIIVEPSGVGKLSDVIKAIEDSGLADSLNTYVCIVDSLKAKVYAKNFKEFFADQIANAKTVILSRTDIASEDKINTALEVIRNINDSCKVVVTPISELSYEELLNVYEKENVSLLTELLEEEHHNEECSCGHHHHHDEECSCGHHHHHDEECECGHRHHHHDEECECGHHHHQDEECECGQHHHHDEECECGHHHHHDEECSCGHHHHHDEECECGHHHHHHADEVFNSISMETPKVYCFEGLVSVLNELAYTKKHGYVVRAKGILKTTDGWKKFNITPEELLIEDTEAIAIGVLCVIGTHLDEEVIKKLF